MHIDANSNDVTGSLSVVLQLSLTIVSEVGLVSKHLMCGLCQLHVEVIDYHFEDFPGTSLCRCEWAIENSFFV